MDRYETKNGRQYRKYEVTADLLCVGDRMRGSVFRPCLDVLPATTLEGALRERFPRPDRCVFPIGRILEARREALIYSPRDRVAGVSKVPIQTEYLTDVKAVVFIRLNDWTEKFDEEFSMCMGAMRAKGFGWTKWRMAEDKIEAGPPVQGKLYSRIPDVDKWKNAFGVVEVKSPVVGYLPIPERGARTSYQRALFEGSIVCADSVSVLQDDGVAPLNEPEVHDPMAQVLASLEVDTKLRAVSSTLAAAGSVVARYGYGVAELYLQEKLSLAQKDKQWVKCALAALDTLQSLEPTRSNPELGAFVLKKLHLVPEWQKRFGKDVPGGQRLEPQGDELRDAIRGVVERIQSVERAQMPRSFVAELANAVGRFGCDATLDRLDKKERHWDEQRREGRRAKGQPKPRMNLARRLLEEIKKEERLATAPNIARLAVRRAFADDSKGQRNRNQPRRKQRR